MSDAAPTYCDGTAGGADARSQRIPEATPADRALRILDARARLLHTLSEIAGAAAEQARTRCPYRTRTDRCTFRGDCRNRSDRHCTGGTLDPRPASTEELAVVLINLDAATATDVSP